MDSDLHGFISFVSSSRRGIHVNLERLLIHFPPTLSLLPSQTNFINSTQIQTTTSLYSSITYIRRVVGWCELSDSPPPRKLFTVTNLEPKSYWKRERENMALGSTYVACQICDKIFTRVVNIFLKRILLKRRMSIITFYNNENDS